jgi:type IX secretion system substrate protein
MKYLLVISIIILSATSLFAENLQLKVSEYNGSDGIIPDSIVVTDLTYNTTFSYSNTDQIDLTTITGVDDNLDIKQSISFYPNPLKENGTLVINSITSSSQEMILTDISGRLLYRKSVNIYSGRNEFQVNIASLQRGVYLLTCGSFSQLIQKTENGNSSNINIDQVSSGKVPGIMVDETKYSISVYKDGYYTNMQSDLNIKSLSEHLVILYPINLYEFENTDIEYYFKNVSFGCWDSDGTATSMYNLEKYEETVNSDDCVIWRKTIVQKDSSDHYYILLYIRNNEVFYLDLSFEIPVTIGNDGIVNIILNYIQIERYNYKVNGSHSCTKGQKYRAAGMNYNEGDFLKISGKLIK